MFTPLNSEQRQSDLFSVMAVIPRKEVFCYEAIWSVLNGMRFQDLNSFLQKRFPSDSCPPLTQEAKLQITDFLTRLNIDQYNVLLRETPDYPKSLNVLDLPLLYYRGDISLINSPCISIVGSRNASERGKRSARRISAGLSRLGYTIVSGLAKGIDTNAHNAAIECSGKTIGVIGTPINQNYPPENKELQERIANEHLLISHVPFYRYSKQNYKINRAFFPERNKIMAALSSATIIAEASNTSGSLIQAREAQRFGKIVIILKPSYDDSSLTWPKTYVKRGAFVAESLAEIKEILEEKCADGLCGTEREEPVGI